METKECDQNKYCQVVRARSYGNNIKSSQPLAQNCLASSYHSGKQRLYRANVHYGRASDRWSEKSHGRLLNDKLTVYLNRDVK